MIRDVQSLQTTGVNDTQFGDGNVIQQHIDAGISLSDALNFLVEKSELVRVDRPSFSLLYQSPFIGPIQHQPETQVRQAALYHLDD